MGDMGEADFQTSVAALHSAVRGLTEKVTLLNRRLHVLENRPPPGAHPGVGPAAGLYDDALSSQCPGPEWFLASVMGAQQAWARYWSGGTRAAGVVATAAAVAASS